LRDGEAIKHRLGDFPWHPSPRVLGTHRAPTESESTRIARNGKDTIFIGETATPGTRSDSRLSHEIRMGFRGSRVQIPPSRFRKTLYDGACSERWSGRPTARFVLYAISGARRNAEGTVTKENASKVSSPIRFGSDS